MSLLRAVLLEFLVCFHVIGAAVLFRRIFPRESSWLAFFVPTLALMFLLNGIEHFVALPILGWLLPISFCVLGWALAWPGTAWEDLRLPGILFVVAFTYILIIRGLHPEIACWTEGMSDLNRMLDFCLGEKVPPTDSWLPPYDHGGYYTFQHYGASILKRLFTLDIGTAYNLSLTLLNTLICLMAAALAFSISGKKWIAVAMMLVVAACFTGSAVIMMFFNPGGVDHLLAYDLHHGWAHANHNPLWKLLDADPYKQRTRLFTPAYGIHLPEFHANLGGHFLTLMSIFAAMEVRKEMRSNWPWILLIVLPVLTIITATWFLPVVLFFCVGGTALALTTSRRPENARFVVLASVIAIGLIWPSVILITGSSYPQPLRWTLKEEHTFPWLFVEQWWPVYVPWLFLCFAWRRLSPEARWLHAAIPFLLILFEFVTIGDREPTLEKIWSALYGAGLVAFLTLVFMQNSVPFRMLTFFMLSISALSLGSWGIESGKGVDWGEGFFRLQGDKALHYDPQRKRLLQVMQRLHGAIVLSGKSAWGYSETPTVAAFSENRCFVGWTFPEELAGNGEESLRRGALSNAFYAGAMEAPLPFLAANNIAAVLIWPDDVVPDNVLTQLQSQLAPAYYYVDCKGGGPNNAGVFLLLPESINNVAGSPRP